MPIFHLGLSIHVFTFGAFDRIWFSGGGADDRDRLSLSHVPRSTRIITILKMEILGGIPPSSHGSPTLLETLINQPPRQSSTSFLTMLFLLPPYVKLFYLPYWENPRPLRQNKKVDKTQYQRIYISFLATLSFCSRNFRVYTQHQRLASNHANFPAHQGSSAYREMLSKDQPFIPSKSPENHHLDIRQLDTSLQITRVWWSIPHSAYIDRAAMAALRCSGPIDPFLASSCVLQMQVARLRRSRLGVPNQYLSSDKCQPGLVLQVHRDNRDGDWQAGHSVLT